MAEARFRQEREHANIFLAVGVGMVSLIIFAAGVVCSYFVQVAHTRLLFGGARMAIALPVDAWRLDRGLVFFSPFFVDRVGVGREQQRGRLTTYGWSDRTNQRIHIPIDRAIELYLSGAAPAPTIIRPHSHPGVPWAPGRSGNPDSFLPPASVAP